MSLVLCAVLKEKERLDYMLAAYAKQLECLPKGSVTAKKVGQNVYYYLRYRDGKRVFTDYLGKDSEKVQAVRIKLNKRRHIETMAARLKSDLSLANKVLEGSK
jgi:hypothetical protein